MCVTGLLWGPGMTAAKENGYKLNCLLGALHLLHHEHAPPGCITMIDEKG